MNLMKVLMKRRRFKFIYYLVFGLCFGYVFITISCELLAIGRKQINYIQHKYQRFQEPIYVHVSLTQNKKREKTCEALIVNSTQQEYFNINGDLYPKYVPLYYNKSIDFKCMNSVNANKRNRILLWSKFCGTTDYHYGIGYKEPFVANGCPITNCEITTNRSLLNESDIVVMHVPETSDIPKYKFTNQRWVWFLYESPMSMENTIELDKFDGLFNMSSTYRLDSNTTSLYFAESTFYWQQNQNFNADQDFHGSKDRFGVALISNCNDRSNRLAYIRQLQKYISIDILGRCGQECPFNCKEFIEKRYKFYFAFENSICRDYITEKFFGMLKYNIIPVVLGGGQYDLFVPKSGYISALDYDSPKSLARYLTHLSNDKVAYNSYFKWKKYVVFDSFKPFHGHICEWCILLNMDSFKDKIETHVIQNAKRFWNPTRDCNISISTGLFRFMKYEPFGFLKGLNPSGYINR